MIRFFKKHLIWLTLLLISIFVIKDVIKNKYYEKEDGVIIHDVVSYYSYLPSFFIYDDLSLMYSDSLDPQLKKDYVWYGIDENGKRFLKYTMGVAYFYAPFFLIADNYVKLTDWERTGFNMPYKLSVQISSLFFLLLGLYFVSRFLLKYFNQYTVALCLISLALATNLYNYSLRDGGMSHVYSFFLYALYIFLIDSWHSKRISKYLLLIAPVLALMILVRPTHGLAILFLLLWKVDSIKGFSENIKFLFSNYKIILLSILLALLVFLPQLVYWKVFTGNWIFYSYSEEGFFFNDPKILEGLLSFRKGWLIYSPIFIFTCLGLFFKDELFKKLKFVFYIFILIQLYITFSWWCWWYGGSFGMRTLIDYSVLFTIPMAVVYEKFTRYKVSSILLILIISGAAYLNIFQTRQYKNFVLHYDSMTYESYKFIWGRKKYDAGVEELLKHPNYPEAMKGNRCD